MNHVINTDQHVILEKLNQFYPNLEPALRELISQKALLREYRAGEELMKPGSILNLPC
jgi:hypothetical protein